MNKIDFSSKYNFIGSIHNMFGLESDEANTMLWILDMWDKKQWLPEPTEFKLQEFKSKIDYNTCLLCSAIFNNPMQKQLGVCGECLKKKIDP